MNMAKITLYSIPPLATKKSLVYSDDMGDGLYRRHG